MRHAKRPTPLKKNDQRDWGLLFLVLAIFLFIAALFIEGERDSNEQSSLMSGEGGSPSVDKREALKHLDYNLKDGMLKDELSKSEIKSDNAAAESIDQNAALTTSEHLDNVNPLVFDQENYGKKVLNDTDAPASTSSQGLTPEQRISAKIERDQWAQDYEKRHKAEYVKQFLENARQKGVDIRLNENLDVTGIDRFEVEKPIRVPQSESKSSTGGNK